GASRWQILTRIVLPLAVPGLISAFIFCFTLCWNEFIYALTFISSTQYKTVPVAIVTALVDGDIYRWGSLMAGAMIGSLPLVILYAFFVEHYVSAMKGAVKGKALIFFKKFDDDSSLIRTNRRANAHSAHAQPDVAGLVRELFPLLPVYARVL